MASVTFQVIDGVDRGRIFGDLPTPVTIGREEGNVIRLNDERVSRFHAKVQQDQNDVILTDLESTNGTRANGHAVQIRRLRPGDRISVGRTVLLFGSNEEIASRLATFASKMGAGSSSSVLKGSNSKGESFPATVQASEVGFANDAADIEFDVNDPVKLTDGALLVGQCTLPPLPLQLTPSQAARLAELLDFLHRRMAQIGDHTRANEEGNEITLDFATWQKVQAVQMLLARYLRAVTDPDSMKS